MPGTQIGGKAAAETNKKKYGDDFYKKIGAKGGLKSRGGGFAAATPEQVREWGRKGGKISRPSTNREIKALQDDKEKDQKFWRTLRGLK